MRKKKSQKKKVLNLSAKIIRTDRWLLVPTPEQKILLEQTISEYQRLVKALTGVALTHWTFIKSATDAVMAMEQLIHKTAKRPEVKYDYFDECFHKFPSYLRRAAIETAVGQVSSFLTRYYDWQGGKRERTDAKPPRFNPNLGVYPNLYQGQSVKFNSYFSRCEIKVFTGSDWIWITIPIIHKGQRHFVITNERLSAALIVNQKTCHLSVPFLCKPQKLPEGDKVVAVDLGMNTTATVSVVNSNGTVIVAALFARREPPGECRSEHFIHPARDIDHRDKRLRRISSKAKWTIGGSKNGKLYKGFCRGNYRKATNINREIGQKVSFAIVQIAQQYGAKVIVFEDLSGWRPKGGKKNSTLRQRYHGWLHRRITELTEMKWEELGGEVEYVNPAYTSKYAYDGSGEVRRDSKNYAHATFQTGKQYNADLNGSLNIAARYWHKKLKLSSRNGSEVWASKSSAQAPRIPVAVSVLWSSSSHDCRAEPPPSA